MNIDYKKKYKINIHILKQLICKFYFKLILRKNILTITEIHNIYLI